MNMTLNRRSLITGLISLVAAPAIVRAQNLMPVKASVVEDPSTYIIQCGPGGHVRIDGFHPTLSGYRTMAEHTAKQFRLEFYASGPVMVKIPHDIFDLKISSKINGVLTPLQSPS
jgi:hypothetical protein